MEGNFLSIKDLHINVNNKEILKGLNLNVNKGEIHVIMGPNGAGKSTLANTLMGHPKYSVSRGEILFEGKLINELKADERARLGIFLSFQYPEEISGITVENFLRAAKASVTGKSVKLLEFRKQLKEKMALLDMDAVYSQRYLNLGFSGGEKKKNEILQMAVLEPKLILLDETDSGLDVDAVKVVSKGVKMLAGKENSIIIITHHMNILDYLKPDHVHVLMDGRIIKSGGFELAEEIESNGYGELKERVS